MGAQGPASIVPRDVDDTAITSAEALDAAFSGQRCWLVRPDGTRRALATSRWSGSASAADRALFVAPCAGLTLDVGCGPGRLAEALAHGGVEVLGVDISPEAVRQTRRRGAAAVCQDVLVDPLGLDPRIGRPWRHVLLADGNIGLGGDPVGLLRRVAALLAPGGTVLAEVAPPGSTAVHTGLRLVVGGRRTSSFDWATVGADEVARVARDSGLDVVDLRSRRGRHVATLAHQPASARS